MYSLRGYLLLYLEKGPVLAPDELDYSIHYTNTFDTADNSTQGEGELLQRYELKEKSQGIYCSTIGGGGGDVTNLSPFGGEDSTKIATAGDIFDQPPGGMS